MSNSERRPRRKLRRAGIAAALVVALAPGEAASAAPGGDLGAVTGFEAGDAAFTLESGTAKVRVKFLADDVVRIWLAPDGTFSDPANTAPEDPSRPSSNIVIKTDYPTPTTRWDDRGDHYSLRTAKAELRAQKNPLRFSLHRPDGHPVWSEVKPLTWTDTSTTQTLARQPREQFVGGGMQNGRFSHRGQTIRISRDFNWTDGGNPNASPYYMSTAGYGVLRNTFAPGTYAFNEPLSTKHDEKRFDAYYFVGDMKTSLDRYTELTGRPFLPPLYGMEYGDSDCYNRGHYRPGLDPDPNNDWKYHPDKEVTPDAAKIAQKFVDHDMPRGWMLVNDDYGCGYSNDRDAYIPNPNQGGVEKYVGTRDLEALKATGEALRQRGVQMGLWTEAALDRQPEEVGQAGVRVRKLDVAWVGPGYRHALSACDTAHRGIEEHSDARGYSWMVEGWAGAQRCAVQWTGDHSGTLDNIKWQIPAIHGSGNSGIAYAAGDIDGIFGGSATSYVRDLQWKAFNPALMTMSGWSTPKFKQPWAYGEPYTAINRQYLKLRERLLPYFYSYAAEAHRTGAPINRSLILEYPNDPNTWDDTTKYQFLAGKEFLVAPVFTDSEVKSGIYLPEGTWIDYWSGRLHKGPTTLNGYHAPLDRLPLFVKAGAVVPMWRDGINGHAEQRPGERVTLDIYPKGRSSFELYEDDRVTRAHRDGASATQKFEVTAPTTGRGDVVVRIGRSEGDYAGKPAQRPYELTAHTGTKPGAVIVDGKALRPLSKADYGNAETGWYYDESDRGGVVNVKTAAVSTDRQATVVLSGASAVGGSYASDSFGVAELAAPDLWNAPGQVTEVTASFRNDSNAVMRDVKLGLTLPEGWTAQGSADFRWVVPGQTVQRKIAVTPIGKAGRFTIGVKAGYTARGTQYECTAVASALVPFGSVGEAADTVGITDAKTFALGKFDPDGNSFAAELLAEKGFTPGAKVTANGAEFTLPAGAPGTPNMVKNTNLPILVSGKGSHLAFLASGASTNATGSVTVLYTDGTESRHSLQVPNWSFQDAGTGGAKLAASVKGRYTPTGLANTDVDYRLFYNTVELTPGKTARAVKLPAGTSIGFFAATVHDRPLPPAPKGEAWVSDLEWISAVNGWGPVERDRSNNESAGGDGNPLTLNGVVYAKGLGAHAVSDVKVNLGGTCSKFTAKVGVDDEMADRGSVVFKVVVDGVEKYASPVLTGNSATVSVDVDVSGGKVLDLVLGDGGNGIGSDHGDWAEAKLTCGP
ncbi:NPCBM/NEW2 domain-containing protein [Actinosynnema sp. CA-248983]